MLFTEEILNVIDEDGNEDIEEDNEETPEDEEI